MDQFHPGLGFAFPDILFQGNVDGVFTAILPTSKLQVQTDIDCT